MNQLRFRFPTCASIADTTLEGMTTCVRFVRSFIMALAPLVPLDVNRVWDFCDSVVFADGPLAKPDRERLGRDLATRHRERDFLEIVGLGVERPAVHLEEKLGRRRAHALVAVHERMIRDESVHESRG